MNTKESDFLESNAYVSANDLVDGLCIREDDFDKKKKPKFLFLLKEVFQELNLNVIRQTDRMILPVNKKLKYIDVPDGYLDFSSISAPDHRGQFRPMVINKNIPVDFVDIGASPTCGCDCGCDCQYCSNITNYEVISSIVMAPVPGGAIQAFTATQRKKMYKDGRYVRETTTPVQRFVNNTLQATELETTTEFLCNLEVKECGCLADTPQNTELIFKFCDSCDVAFDCGCPVVVELPNQNYYNINQIGNRIQLPPNFTHDHVLLRYYADRKTRDLRIPYMAQKPIRFGIKAEETTFTAPGSKENLTFIRLFGEAREELADNLSKIKLSDFYSLVLGQFKVL